MSPQAVLYHGTKLERQDIRSKCMPTSEWAVCVGGGGGGGVLVAQLLLLVCLSTPGPTPSPRHRPLCAPLRVCFFQARSLTRSFQRW